MSRAFCCTEQHFGPVCPDGLVMCCLCRGRFSVDELYSDATGTTWDICDGCGREVGEE